MSGPSARRPRMSDVASRAGVGTITVSRALKTPHLVSDAVRQRVLEAVQATGYVPNLAASTLKSHRSTIVAAIVPTLRNAIFAQTTDALAEGLRAHGYQLMLASTGYSPEAEEEILRHLMGQQPAAVVLTGIGHTRAVRQLLAQRRMPVIETWDLTDRPIDRVVGFSNFEAMRQMTRALADRGYRRIALAGSAAGAEPRATRRLQGYLHAMTELGREARVVELPGLALDIASGAHALQRLMALDPAPDAAIFVTDVLAFGAAQACQQQGIAVPGRLALAGLGDFELARAAHPPLTTVRIPGEQIGRTAATMIADLLSGDPERVGAVPQVVDLGCEIVFRSSA